MKKVLILIALAIAGIVTTVIIFNARGKVKPVNADDRIIGLEDYVEACANYTESLDTYVSAYCSNEISEKDFLNELEGLNAELDLINESYNVYVAENPINQDTVTYVSTIGEGAVTKLNSNMNDFKNCLYKGDNSLKSQFDMYHDYFILREQASSNAINYFVALEVLKAGKTLSDEDVDRLLKETTSVTKETIKISD